MTFNTAVMFGKASDEWETPQDLFDELNEEFGFVLDAAATRGNSKCADYLGPDHCWAIFRNALGIVGWHHAPSGPVWLNPPYSLCREFIAKAAQQARAGCTVVALVPSRTDTRWFHESIWDTDLGCPRSGVEVRFVKGRLKFGGTGKVENSAPFPSMVVIFRPVKASA